MGEKPDGRRQETEGRKQKIFLSPAKAGWEIFVIRVTQGIALGGYHISRRWREGSNHPPARLRALTQPLPEGEEQDAGGTDKETMTHRLGCAPSANLSQRERSKTQVVLTQRR